MARKDMLFCAPCGKTLKIGVRSTMVNHVRGKMHKRKLERYLGKEMRGKSKCQLANGP